MRWILTPGRLGRGRAASVHETGHRGADFERRKIEGAALFSDVPFLIWIGLAIFDF